MKSLIECSLKLGKSSVSVLVNLLISLSNVVLSGLAIFLLRAYKLTISPWFGPACRFDPSCSQYAMEAFQKYPPHSALWFTVRRLSKCHPFGSFGYDPLPSKESRSC